MSLIIGVSNGWLFAHDICSFEEHRDFFKEVGVDAIEFVIRFEKERQAILNADLGLDLKFKSVHLPSFSKVDNSLDEHIDLLKKIVDSGKFDSVLVHPTMIPNEYWEFIDEKEIVVSVENMDKRNDQGWRLDDIRLLLDNHNIGFVFDVQHAYEHDNSMGYAKRLFELVKDKITHFHVSGMNSAYFHILVNKSHNKDVILDFLRWALEIRNVPLIIEGKYRTVKQLKAEVDFLRSELE